MPFRLRHQLVLSQLQQQHAQLVAARHRLESYCGLLELERQAAWFAGDRADVARLAAMLSDASARIEAINNDIAATTAAYGRGRSASPRQLHLP